jgi:hypothetical protein
VTSSIRLSALLLASLVITLAWDTGDLAAFWTVEENPYRKIRRELLETVLLPGWHEDHRPTSNRVPRTTIEELTVSTHHNVDLVPRVGPLAVDATRRVELNFQ